MTFQSTVQLDQADIQVGELAFGGPFRAEPKRLASTDPANNVIGRAFSQSATVDDEVTADLGSEGIFAGILVNPKEHTLRGTAAGGTLAPSITLPNETEVSMLREGTIPVELTTAADIGDILFFDHGTGEIQAAAPGTATPAGTTPIPNGEVVRMSIAAPGKAYIHIK